MEYQQQTSWQIQTIDMHQQRYQTITKQSQIRTISIIQM